MFLCFVLKCFSCNEDFVTFLQHLSVEKPPEMNFPYDKSMSLDSFVAILGRALAGAEPCQGEMLGQPQSALISLLTCDLQSIPPLFGRSGVRNPQRGLPVALRVPLVGLFLWQCHGMGTCVKNRSGFGGVFYRSFHIAFSSAATYSRICTMRGRQQFEGAASAICVDKGIVTSKYICSFSLF